MSKTVFYAMDPVYLQAYIDHKNEIAAAIASGNYGQDVIEKVKAEIGAYRDEKKELYSADQEGVAHINVSGPLEPKPDPCAVMFDIEMTTYSDIIEATRQAENNPNVVSLAYHFSTPGGNVVGLFRTADAIASCKKPTHGIVHGLCASAGYALASQCKTIDAENISAEIGSIGVVTEMADYSEAEKGRGIKRYILTSANAENKRPDVTTDDGRAKIISRLTALEGVFVEYVARGRGTTEEKVLSDFGRGGILISREALRVGMIDGIITEMQSTVNSEATEKTEMKDQTRNATESEKKEKENSTMEMTQEALDKIIADTAKQTAESVKAELSAENQAKETARAENEKRVAGFKPLYEKYPEQKAFIDAEVAKEGATASAAFAITLADAETARLAALNEQNKANDEKPGDLKTDGNKTDNSGNAFVAMMLGGNVGEV